MMLNRIEICCFYIGFVSSLQCASVANLTGSMATLSGIQQNMLENTMLDRIPMLLFFVLLLASPNFRGSGLCSGCIVRQDVHSRHWHLTSQFGPVVETIESQNESNREFIGSQWENGGICRFILICLDVC